MSELNVHCKYDALVDPRSLKPHPKNRNKHSKEQISRLSKIIAHQGQRAPVVVSNLSGCIVKGHGTTLSVIEFDNLPLEEFPNNTRIASDKIAVVYQDFPDEETEYQFLIGDNAIAEWAELDLSGINLDIQEIGPFDIELLGLKDFVVEPLEKIPAEEKPKEKKTHECPECGAVF